MVAETSELRSGITSAFNKRLNEALQFNPQMGFNIENTVTPSQTIAVLKGEQGTPGLPAAISAVKDDNNLIMLAVSPMERGTAKFYTLVTTLSVAGGESQNVDLAVPAGKKWILKGLSSSKNTVATITLQYCFIRDGTNSMQIASGTNGDLSLLPGQPITLPYGFYLRYRITTTAWTSGQVTTTFLVQEYDI